MKKNKQIQPVEMPPVKDFLEAVQRDGAKLCADFVFSQTMNWIKSIDCENPVSEQIVEQYAMSVARWVHLEQKISEYGYIAKHPTTGAPMQSPYVTMSQAYMKQILAIRSEIQALIKDSRPASPSIVREVVYGE
ncbi:MAG: P27 family phage terminase small subunit [Ruminiclostridium sp.]|jgi:hypothetical protein|nr:P27 family phage terminase small subunit [Ruminiclostridium sp.]